MVATPRQDGLTDRLKAVSRQLEVLSRTRYTQYQRIPLLSTAANNDYSNTTTTAKQLAIGGYTFSASVPAIHVGWYVTLTASGGAAAAQLTVQAVDAETLAVSTLLTITGTTPGAGVLSAALAGTLTGVIDTAYQVPSSWYGHTVVLQCYSQMLSGTGTIVAYPVYATEAAS
jgi:hypothetical protein